MFATNHIVLLIIDEATRGLLLQLWSFEASMFIERSRAGVVVQEIYCHSQSSSSKNECAGLMRKNASNKSRTYSASSTCFETTKIFSQREKSTDSNYTVIIQKLSHHIIIYQLLS